MASAIPRGLRRFAWAATILYGLASAAPAIGTAMQEQGGSPPQPVASGQRVSVQGVVKNAATGEPLPRALVRIEGDATAGALTDGDGHFEIPGVPVGPQSFQVIKPGFRDVSESATQTAQTIAVSTSDHNVHVAPGMEDLAFAMSPNNSVRGQITLSSGDPAQGIGVMLLRKAVQDGRSFWAASANARTNSEGVFRFAGLADGEYAIYTDPAMDTDLAVSLVEPGRAQQVSREGYPSVFYPDARDLGGAARIQLAGGQQGQANLLLTQEPFHLARAAVTMQGGGANALDEPFANISVTVFDAQGHQLPYGAEFDRPSHAVQAFLPDGTYSFVVTAMNPPKFIQTNGRFALRNSPAERQLIGQVEFSVNGRPVTNLRMALAPQQSGTVQVSLLHSNAQTTNPTGAQNSPIVVLLSQAGGWITDGMISSYAEGYPTTGSLETTPMGPGSYWVHTNIPQKSICEGSFTAGGASLAREPLALGLAGAGVPLILTLRDDCAALKISLPPEVQTPASGDEPFYTAYVVPDFDSTTDITPITLRPSSGGSFTEQGLTPGAYHVYTFGEPVELEYRNPEAMAQLGIPGQAVTVEPGGTTSLVVEVARK